MPHSDIYTLLAGRVDSNIESDQISYDIVPTGRVWRGFGRVENLGNDNFNGAGKKLETYNSGGIQTNSLGSLGGNPYFYSLLNRIPKRLNYKVQTS